MKTTNDASAAHDPGEAVTDARLEALFQHARRYAPSHDQLARMLRAVPAGRRHVRRRIVEFAVGLASAAAVVTLAWLVILPPNQPRALALSDVAAAMRSAPSIHVTYDDGTVYWYRYDEFTVYVSPDGLTTHFENWDTLECADYDAHRGKKGAIILRTMDPHNYRRLDDTEVQKPHIDQFIQEAERKGRAFEDVWQRSERVQDGRAVIQLTTTEPNRRGIVECTVDARTGMMISSRSASNSAVYSYPTKELRDIYDLGVPRDTPVLDWRPGPELYALRDNVVAAQNEPSGAYWMASVQIGRYPDGHVFITDGVRWRTDHVPKDRLRDITRDELQQFTDSLLTNDPCDWGRTSQYFDGGSLTLFQRDEADQPRSRHARPANIGDAWMYALMAETWGSHQAVFFLRARDGYMEYLGENERGWLGTRVLTQATRFDRPVMAERWYDPAHGYRPVRYARFSFPEAPWQLRPDWQDVYINGDMSPIIRELPDAPAHGTETEVLEWAELRPERWYPALREVRYLVQAAEGEWIPSTDEGNREGWIIMGQILKFDPSKERPPLPSTSYVYIAAQPLEDIPEECFTIPAEWLETPVETGP